MLMANDLLTRIAVDPKVMAGKPVIRGTRIPVDLLIRMYGQGMSEAEILAEYPRLQSEDLRAAFLYAAQVVAQEDVFPSSTTS
jgi:uncharacterized protein (DUF433 family)